MSKYRHYCYDWDELLIDETCPEFASCFCYEQTDEVKQIKEKLYAQMNVVNDNGIEMLEIFK